MLPSSQPPLCLVMNWKTSCFSGPARSPTFQVAQPSASSSLVFVRSLGVYPQDRGASSCLAYQQSFLSDMPHLSIVHSENICSFLVSRALTRLQRKHMLFTICFLLIQSLPIDPKSFPQLVYMVSERVIHICFATHSKSRCVTDSFSEQRRHLLSSMFFLMAKLSLVRTLFLVKSQMKK